MPYFLTETDHTNALLDNLEARERELAHYQTNITNFRRAIAKLKAMPETETTKGFAAELAERLKGEELGLFRTQTIHDVILDQLEGKDVAKLIKARPKKE